MTVKSEFNAQEWSTLTEAPAVAGALVAAAGRGGTLREGLALGQTYQEERGRADGGLLSELLASPPSIPAQRLSSRDELREHVRTQLREAVGVLEAKATPDELEGYRAFVLAVADRVARAHKEGGVLGIGGHEVSGDEQAALDEVAAALGAR